MKKEEHCIVCNNKQTYTLTIAPTVSLPRKEEYKLRSIELINKGSERTKQRAKKKLSTEIRPKERN